MAVLNEKEASAICTVIGEMYSAELVSAKKDSDLFAY